VSLIISGSAVGRDAPLSGASHASAVSHKLGRMNTWKWAGDLLHGGVGMLGGLLAWSGGVLAHLRDPVARRDAAFSAALIALSAKMAKADGVVTASEVAAFRRIFRMPVTEQTRVASLFDLARRDIAGYEAYAARVARLYSGQPQVLEDVLDGLFFIAGADGEVHEAELAFLENVAAIFGFRDAAFERILARHVIGPEGDPYRVLGVQRGTSLAEIRTRYRQLVNENHPDRFIARGMPTDFIAIATDRLAAINRAFEAIERELGDRPVPAVPTSSLA
jgi:DnaJ like chaperone protein